MDSVVAPGPDIEGVRSRARWAVIALGFYALFGVFAFASGVAEYQLLGTDYTLEEAYANDDRQTAISLIQGLLLVITAVLFVRWFKRAYDNVEALGGKRRFGTGWAIGAWFVPFLNLWRPKQIANDIWIASSRNGEPGVSGVLAAWWAAWLIASWVGNATLRFTFAADTAEELQGAAAANVAAIAMEFVAALLALFVVRAITARQSSAAAPLGDVGIEGAAL